MLAPERHQRILHLLTAQGSVRTIDLARLLKVTEETIRRDLEKLDHEGRLIRTHGGAIREAENRRDLPLTSREAMNIAEKQSIARQALTAIDAGQTILLDASTTAFELATLLPNIELTILTNGLKTALELAKRPAAQVVLVGGSVSAASLACVGPLSDQILASHNIQKAFLSCRGIDIDRGLSEANEQHAHLHSHMIALSQEVYLLADHSKLGLKSSYFFAKLADIDFLITNRKPIRDFAKAIRQAGVELQITS
ncbi:MAG: DeoR/GlpR family DNA-binding transcription regulator [Chthoniobacterales bacterium]